MDAAVRETLEETGWQVRLTGFVGAYQWKSPVSADGSGRHYLQFAFVGEPVSRPGPVRWMTASSARPVADPGRTAGSRAAPPQPAGLAYRRRFLAGRRFPLDLLNQL